jgi:diguanylate cyclase (GGDEF)-like protein
VVGSISKNGSWRSRLSPIFAPFTSDIPATVREPLILLQYERLHALTPILYLTIIANSIAMALAVQGILPAWQQILPPTILISVSLWQLIKWRTVPKPTDAAIAHRKLRGAIFVAVGLGLVSGLWCVNAFRETEQYRCVVAPVFIALSALVSATCLTSIPRAAIAAMVTALTPIVIAMLLFDDMGLRAMAVMLIIITALQSGVVRSKFSETVRMLTLQHEVTLLAETDVLTGLKNRRAFTQQLQAETDQGNNIIVAMIDLDGFKLANDTYGHLAGDAVLSGVAGRMTTICVSATCVARLGGDEFAIIFAAGTSSAQAEREIEAAHAAIGMPFHVADAVVMISASSGIAQSPRDGNSVSALLHAADTALYAQKNLRHSVARKRAA